MLIGPPRIQDIWRDNNDKTRKEARFGGDSGPLAEPVIASINRMSSSVELTWPVATGRNRDVEYSETLAPLSCIAIASRISAGTYADSYSAHVSKARGFMM